MRLEGSNDSAQCMEMNFLVTKILGPAQKIIWGGRSPMHVSRWILFRSKLFEVCLDHCDGEFSNGDRSNYPDRFVSVGLATSRSATGAQPIRSLRDQGAWMVLVGKQSESVRRRVA